MTRVVLTKLDVLTGFTIQICEAWEINGERHFFVPADDSAIGKATPYYQPDPGAVYWYNTDLSSIRRWQDLPPGAQDYVEKIEAQLNYGAAQPIKIELIGVGPEPDAIIRR